METASVGVGEFPAGTRSEVIDHAIVVRHKKGTWRFLKNVIVIFIFLKVLFGKCRGFHFEMFGHPFHILVNNYGTCGFAAVGTGKAVDVFENFLMKLMDHIIQITRFFPAELVKKGFVVLVSVLGFLFEFV